MTEILPTDRAILYCVTDAPDADPVHGTAEVGDETAVSIGLSVIQNEDEVAFVGALAAEAFDPLPDSGWLERGDIYAWNGQAVMVRQSHNRTEHDPADVPALFVVWREDADEVLEWVVGESVVVGTRRIYDDVLYQCIQAHVTQSDWTPTQTPTLWSVVAQTDEWQSGVWYDIRDVVLYDGAEYECIQAHTSQTGWEPPNVPALWSAL